MSINLLTNGLVQNEYPEGFLVFKKQPLWHVARNEKGISVTMNSDTPGLVMNTDYASPYKAFTKKQFQSVHNGSASEQLKQEVLDAYGQNADSFQTHMRTIGCGTNLCFQCKDGLFQAFVQRTAPSKTPEGVVQAGAFSRAAGGANGPILETQYRELIEEMNIFIRRGEKITSVDVCRSDAPASKTKEQGFFANKHKNLKEIFSQVASEIGGDTNSLQTETRIARPIFVQSLHEIVEQNMDGHITIFHAVVEDDPKNGDISGIDSILVLDIRDVHSSQITIADGERGQKDELLGRPWRLAKPEFLQSNLDAGTMKFSPVLAKILRETPRVLTEIARFNP